MVDFLIMIQIVGAGDSLQMIKRGVFEKINLLLINKAEQERLQLAKIEAEKFRHNFELFTERESGLKAKVLICSSIEKTGFEKIWASTNEFILKSKESNYFSRRRKNQNMKWFEKLMNHEIYEIIESRGELKKEIERIKEGVKEGKTNPLIASQEIQMLFKSFLTPKNL